MPVCVVKLCKNNTTRNKKASGITYHQLPSDPVLFDRWTDILRLSRQESGWTPGNRSVICSAHFNESDLYFTKGGLQRLCKGAVPQNALYLSSTPPDKIYNSALAPGPSIPVSVIEGPVLASGQTQTLPASPEEVSVRPEPSKQEKEIKVKPNSDNEIQIEDYPDLDQYLRFNKRPSPGLVKAKAELERVKKVSDVRKKIIGALKKKLARSEASRRNLKSIVISLKDMLENCKCGLISDDTPENLSVD